MKSARRLLVALVFAAAGCSSFDPRAVEAFDTLAKGDVAAARTLYEAGADVNAKFQDGMTALMLMSASASGESVEMLLRLGADPNLRSDDGSTALIVAARRGRAETVRLLIAAGADPQAMDDEGRTPRDHALETGHRELLDLLEG